MPIRSMTQKRKRRPRRARKTARRPRLKRTLTAFKGVQQFRRGLDMIAGNLQFVVSSGAGFGPQEDSWVLATNTASNCSYISAAYYYTADMIPSSSRQFLTMFDQYKIRRVVNKITPYSTVATLQNGQAANFANNNLAVLFHDCLDWDDATPFTADAAGIDKMRQRSTYRVRNLFNSSGRPITKSLTPHIALGAYKGSVLGFVGYANKGPTWIDSNSPNVQHYGYKWIMEVFNPNPSISVGPAFIWLKNEAFITLDVKEPI